jgi:alkanesulfonate monooxygenase
VGVKFHWRLVQRGESDTPPFGPAGAIGAIGEKRVAEEAALPAVEEQAEFCRQAEDAGIDSVLVDINLGKPDPMALALPLALATRKLRFMVAHRPGLMAPLLFVQQVNTFSVLTGGRITLNMVAGHSPAEQRAYGDGLGHDERYRRMDEFLAICRRLWDRDGPVSFDGAHYRIQEARVNTPFVSPDGALAPEIYLGGSSRPAREVAARRASCWMRFAEAPEVVRRELAEDGPRAPEVGLRLSVVVRGTREEAVAAARGLLQPAGVVRKRESEAAFIQASDSLSMRATLALAEHEEWLTPCLWAGAVPSHGATALALVGTPEEVAAAFAAYIAAGISQFILSGWPKREEMVRFGRDVLPLIRRAAGYSECQLGSPAA